MDKKKKSTKSKAKKIQKNDKKHWMVEKADTTKRGLKARIIHAYLADGSANISAADIKDIVKRYKDQGYEYFHVRAMSNKWNDLTHDWHTFKGYSDDINIDEDYWKTKVDDTSNFTEFRRVEIVLLNKDQ